MTSLLFRIVALALALARVHGTLRTHENKHDGDDNQQCSLSSLKGPSVYAVNGWIVVDDGSTDVYRYPKASAGKEIYDGKGGLLAVGTVNINGKIERTSNVGTYIVNSDCSGSGQYFNSDGDIVATWDFIIDQKRNRYVWLWTTPGAVGTSYTIFTKTEKLAEIPCSVQTMKGKYIIQPSKDWFKQGDSRVPGAYISQARFDGDGSMTILPFANNNGITQETEHIDGTYHVDSDCTGSVSFLLGAADYYVLPDGSGYTFIRTVDPLTQIPSRQGSGLKIKQHQYPKFALQYNRFLLLNEM